MSVWAHLLPPFDNWWPNVFPATPVTALIIYVLHRVQRTWMKRENARHHAAIRVTMAAHHAAVRKLLYGVAQPEDIVADYAADHDPEPATRPVQPAPDTRAATGYDDPGRVDPRLYGGGDLGQPQSGRHRLRREGS